jgi:hypothetical protein
MAREAAPVDISTMPDLTRLAEEVARTRQPRVLRHGDTDLAVLSPTPSPRRRRTQPLTTEDPLFRHLGTSQSDVTDVSSNKHTYLADAYETKGRGRTP